MLQQTKTALLYQSKTVCSRMILEPSTSLLYHSRRQSRKQNSCSSLAVIFIPPFLRSERNDIMKIEKLPSGSYRVRKMYQGQSYSVTFDYKPTQKEVMQAISVELDKIKSSVNVRMTFQAAAEKYISSKSNVLSPSSINGYSSVLRNISEHFKKKYINDITGIDIQKEINEYSMGRSAKTVRNAHGFISAVLGMFRPELTISTTLPQKIKNNEYIPTDEDVKQILNHSKGTVYEIPLMLATFGLRRSEICALTLDDLNGNILTINKALVLNKDKEFVIKSTKTTEGTREIFIPDQLVALIKESGKIYDGFPGSILRYLNRTQDSLGIPRFKLHALRHYYASMAHSLGIPDSYIMQAGGWKSDTTLKRVYRHAMEDKKEEMQKFAADYITELIN